MVPCEVNGLKLNFVFDTGAAAVSLSSSVADFMLNNGYLKNEDIFDKVVMRQADGSTYSSYQVKLRTIKIGGFVLHDVIGVITPHQDAPLLLGQSAIQKLGKVSMKGNYLLIDKNKRTVYKNSEKDISFLGLKQWTSYDECYKRLCTKYGEYKVLRNEVNGMPSLSIENDIFNGILFDEIVLFFDDGYLNSVELKSYFEKKDRNLIVKKRDDIYRAYAKKYTSIKKYQSSPRDFCNYYMGYENRMNVKDYLKYPIHLYVYTEQLQNLIDDEWFESEYYCVSLTYWPSNHIELFKKNPGEHDDF